MKYSVKIKQELLEGSHCYMCFADSGKNGVLYDVSMTGVETATSDYFLDRQGYYTYLINYTLDGCGVMEYDGATVEVHKGDLLFIDCNKRHVFYPKNGGWNFAYLHTAGPGMPYLYEAFVKAFGNVAHGFAYGKTFLAHLAELNLYLSRLDKEAVNNITYNIRLTDKEVCETSAIIYPILTEIALTVTEHNEKDEMPHSVRKAVEYIRANFCNDITLDEVAAAANLSKYHLERMLERYTGMTFFRYVTELRFDKARWLLKTTDMKILDVALSVGYSDLQALNKLFKKNLSTTPAGYRREMYNYIAPDETQVELQEKT